MKLHDDIEVTLLRERYNSYPPILQIKSVAEILHEDIPTVRARIRRGSFPVAVRQDPGGRQYVLLTDLIRFFISGEIQAQPAMRPAHPPRNPRGLNGTRPRGRPTKTNQLFKEKNHGGLK
jgi:hypothetical protein